MINWQKFKCWFGMHTLRIVEHIRGNRKWGVRIVVCDVGNHCFIMSEEHRAFLRYDNDIQFQKDIKFMYNLDKLYSEK